jgi:HSF-type DNA-binding
MTLLNDPKYGHIIEWLPSGKSFVIYKPKAFATDILPSIFKTAKYSSFTRKLHRWGFVRHFRGGESGAFFHPDFQKGRLHAAEAMTCCPQQQPKEVPSKKERKTKLMKSKAEATTDLTIGKSGDINFQHGMGGDSSNTASVPLNRALLSNVGSFATGAPAMRSPFHLNLNMSSEPVNEYSSKALPGVMANGRHALTQYSGMSSTAGSTNRQDGKYPGLNENCALNQSSAGVNESVFQQQQQHAVMKAQLDAAIKEELLRLEYARLAKERFATANAVHRYNVMLQHQQRQRMTLQSGTDRVLGSLSSSTTFANATPLSLGGTFQSVGDRPIGNLPSSVGFASVTPSSLLDVAGRDTTTLAPVLSQLSRADLEQYALTMSTRHQQASQAPNVLQPKYP